jgi:hypothetical protein
MVDLQYSIKFRGTQEALPLLIWSLITPNVTIKFGIKHYMRFETILGLGA